MKKRDDKIQTHNPAWGFFATIQMNYGFSDLAAARLFDAAGQMLMAELKLPPDHIRNFLDGRYGRHFADELSFHGVKAGMTEKAFVLTLRKFLDSAEHRRWVIREARSSDYERSVE